MSNTKTIEAGERTQKVGTTEYVVISDSNKQVLTKPMTWNDATNWVQSPLTKGAFPEGVTVVPFKQIPQSHFAPRPNVGDCATCGEHRDALCDDGRCWNCSPLGAQCEPREVEPTFTARAAFGGQS